MTNPSVSIRTFLRVHSNGRQNEIKSNTDLCKFVASDFLLALCRRKTKDVAFLYLGGVIQNIRHVNNVYQWH